MIGNLRLFSSVPTQAGPFFDRTQHRPRSTLGTLVGVPAINPFRSVARSENSSSHDDSFVFCVQCFTAALCRRVASQPRRIARRLFKSSAILELQSRICVSAVGGFQSCCRTWIAAAFGSNFLRTYCSKLSRTFAAYCRMAGSVFWTSCWIMPGLWCASCPTPLRTRAVWQTVSFWCPSASMARSVIIVMSLSNPRCSHASRKAFRESLARGVFFAFQHVVRLSLQEPSHNWADGAIRRHSLVVVTVLGGKPLERTRGQHVVGALACCSLELTTPAATFAVSLWERECVMKKNHEVQSQTGAFEMQKKNRQDPHEQLQHGQSTLTWCLFPPAAQGAPKTRRGDGALTCSPRPSL